MPMVDLQTSLDDPHNQEVLMGQTSGPIEQYVHV